MNKHFDIYNSILNGNSDFALNFLYENVLPKFRNYILNNNGTLDEADDIFQDIVLKIYQKIKNNKLEYIENLEGYILGSCKNSWLNRIIKLNKEVKLIQNEEYLSLELDSLEILISKEQEVAFNNLFNSLSPRCKEILIYVIYEKQSMVSISKKMGLLNVNSAKSFHYKCKQQLIELIKKDPILKSLIK